jgi:hypothetical protein
MNEAQKQFVQDFTLVTDNDFEAYTEAMEFTSSPVVEVVAERFEFEFEHYIDTLAKREENAGREYGAMLIRQMLLNQGSDVWRSIARHYMDKE